VPCQGAAKHQGIDWGKPAEGEKHQGTAAIEEGIGKGGSFQQNLGGEPSEVGTQYCKELAAASEGIAVVANFLLYHFFLLCSSHDLYPFLT
jgi:hypothetical protein